jgi:hypothetical protein
VAEILEQPTTDASRTEKADLTITDMAAAKALFDDFDNFQRFRLQVAAEFFEKTSELINAGTALYEKMILLNGATIALSITFLGSLSTRVASTHLSTKPHLWMVALSWSLLLFSTFCCYRVIVDRHSGMLRLLGRVSTVHTEYLYQRIGIVLASLGKLIKGQVPVGDDKVEFTKVTENLNEAVQKEGKTQVKKIEEMIEEGKKTYMEGTFARLAVNSTIVAIGFLCLFTILSLRLLF